MLFNSDLHSLLESGAAKLGITLKPEHVERLYQYFLLLKEPHLPFRVTAIQNDKEIIILHLIDALTVLKYIPECFTWNILDVGAGNGLPGIVVKLLRPEIRVTSIEAKRKPVLYLESVAKALNINSWNIVAGRAEELGHDISYRGQFDFATARALARLRIAAEIILPFVRVGGAFLAMKGPQAAEEIEEAREAVDVLGGKIETVEQFPLPYIEVDRAIVLIRKVKETPSNYPRRYSAIKRKSAILAL